MKYAIENFQTVVYIFERIWKTCLVFYKKKKKINLLKQKAPAHKYKHVEFYPGASGFFYSATRIITFITIHLLFV